MKTATGIVCAVLFLSTSAGATPWKAQAAPSAVVVLGDGGEELARLPTGPTTHLLAWGEYLYVALESGGIEVYRLAVPTKPEAVGKVGGQLRFARLLISEGRLYGLELRREAHAFSLADPARPSEVLDLERVPAVAPAVAPEKVTPEKAAVAPPQEPEQAVVAHVLGVSAGRVLIDAGRKQGFSPGARVQVVAQRLVEVPDLSGTGMRRTPSGETTAVVRIEHADEGRSMAALGRGDVAEIGDLVTLTADPVSERILFPRRAPFSTRFGFHARPFLGLETRAAAGSSKPFGALVDLYGSYYFDPLPVRVEVSASPIGFALGSAEQHYPLTFAATGAYTTDYFEIGLGAGALVGNEGPCPPFSAACEKNTGLTINQVLRLGSLDGLSVTWQSSIFSRPESFTFGVGRAELNLPLTSRVGLFGAGGGGENGWAFGELGVRTFVGGAGARGTMVFSASLGVASIMDGPSHEALTGPAVAFGIEWRR